MGGRAAIYDDIYVSDATMCYFFFHMVNVNEPCDTTPSFMEFCVETLHDSLQVARIIIYKILSCRLGSKSGFLTVSKPIDHREQSLAIPRLEKPSVAVHALPFDRF